MVSACIQVSSPPAVDLVAIGILLTCHSSLPTSMLCRAVGAWHPRVGAALEQHYDLMVASTTQYPVVFNENTRPPDGSDECGWVILRPNDTVPVLYQSTFFAGLRSFQHIRAVAMGQSAHSIANINDIGAITLYICNVSIAAYVASRFSPHPRPLLCRQIKSLLRRIRFISRKRQSWIGPQLRFHGTRV
jgi:hypothetical protein